MLAPASVNNHRMALCRALVAAKRRTPHPPASASVMLAPSATSCFIPTVLPLRALRSKSVKPPYIAGNLDVKAWLEYGFEYRGTCKKIMYRIWNAGRRTYVPNSVGRRESGVRRGNSWEGGEWGGRGEGGGRQGRGQKPTVI
jgi:hypothetical protein